MEAFTRNSTIILLLLLVVNSEGFNKNENEIKTFTNKRPSLEEYDKLRKMFTDFEKSREIGWQIILNDQEAKANEIIMKAKNEEINEGLISPHTFNPSHHLFSVLDKISKSKLFQILKKMPKGGVLHAHDTALSSTDFLIQTTYRENLWACQVDDKHNLNVGAFRFAINKPKIYTTSSNCTWTEMWKIRETNGNKTVDKYLRKQFTMYPTEKYEDDNAAWQKFMHIFILLDGLMLYYRVWVDYYKNALSEFYADGVQYLEFRTTLPSLYDEYGHTFRQISTARFYKNTLDDFIKKNPGFIGSKLIYAPLRNVDSFEMEKYIQLAIELKEEFPTFFAGFDLVGQEELGRPLRDFIPQLLQMPDDIDFFFHAGETNWFGSSTDENLVDAFLLGTKRIGHGYALIKHPSVLELLLQHNIAIEVSPISNQILQLVSDFRNHPCAHFFANNYPVVISSDDPSFWKASPLSHDFYIAFLGIASAHSDLRMLKQLANNSITYSAMTSTEKLVAFDKWTHQWELFIQKLIN